MNSLANYALKNGGSVYPLILPADITNGTGIMNPSVYIDGDKILVNIRHVNYTFFHSEEKTFQHPWGPLTYLHPEEDMHLRTTNYYCEINDAFKIARFDKVDTSKFDTYEPQWDFVGLEDARIFRWDNKLYLSGVRRDTTTNGEGRMELSEIIVTTNTVKEISRVRIPPPQDPNSYCEKNWMPVLDMPYHYVKWGNPTELVSVDPINKTSKTEIISNLIPLPRDLRGGSQIIKLGDYRVAITHEVDLFNSAVGRKDAIYKHRIIVWDKNWNIVKHTDDFSIMDAHVEFAIGMCEYKNDILISFGFQDNAAYLLKLPTQAFKEFVGINNENN